MKKMYRIPESRVIAGICAGAGEAFSMDPLLVRLIFVFLTLATGVFPALFVYIIAWIVLPVKPHTHVTDNAWSSE